MFAVLCPGQGAQHAGMFDLVREHPAALAAIGEARAALDADPRVWLARPDAMFENRIAQPLICVAQVASWRALRDALPPPVAFAGYSVGELACYGLANALEAADLARLARDRARVMDEAAAAHPGVLVAVRGLGRPALVAQAQAFGAFVAIAVGDDVFVVGGDADALAALQAAVERAGAKVTNLRVGLPSHTPRMAAAVPAFRAALEQSPLGAPDPPVVAGIDASFITTRERAIATLAPQLATTTEWAQCLDALYERGCRTFLELGPGHALSGMVRDRFDDVEARCVEEFRDLKGVARWVARNC
jgi:[acyl-carrier-protein] S-malonyltransferase